MTIEAVRLIEHKRDGGQLTADQIGALIAAYLDGGVSDAQLTAFFMAGLLVGFSDEEAVALTDAYVASGDVIDLAALDGPTVDKHSTGGVADTTTFVAGPIMAACGLQLAKLSGRGLGHTGGTLDKLEAIPGLTVDLPPARVARQVNDIGLAVVAATKHLAPADKRTYALRDVTGTVPSRALIAASIMSKKIAGGADHIVLDVKCGDGAFLAKQEDAHALADLCVRIGTAKGRKVAALLTDMSQPLGPAIGNALEVAAAVDVLAGRVGGALRDVSLDLAAQALKLTGAADGADRALRALEDGSALEAFGRMIEAQGGDPGVVEDPWSHLGRAPIQLEVVAQVDGVVSSIACRRLGEVAVTLGAGRLRKDDPVDPAVGLTLDVRVGDTVEAGQRLATVHARTESSGQQVRRLVEDLVALGASGEAGPSVLGVVGG